MVRDIANNGGVQEVPKVTWAAIVTQIPEYSTICIVSRKVEKMALQEEKSNGDIAFLRGNKNTSVESELRSH